jgi:hypothetical protein
MQDRIRPRSFVNGEGVSNLQRKVTHTDEVIIIAALSGG